MLIIIQYSVSDIRNFIETDARCLPYPSWPSPQNNEFERLMGQINRRKRGGLNNWIGESNICEAKQALKIKRWYTYSKNKSFELKLKFRRFFFDGYASGKYEIGFVLHANYEVIKLNELIDELFKLEIRIKLSDGSERVNYLGCLEKDLEVQYYYSSTYSKQTKEQIHDNFSKFIKCSSATIFIEKNILEKVNNNLFSNSAYIDEIDSNITYFNFKNSPVWCLENSQSSLIQKKTIRDIRLILSRLISNRKTIFEILKAIEKGLIRPIPFSKESNLLQEYLLDSIKNILNREKSVKNNDLISLVREVEDRIFSGQNNALFEKLKKTINVRPQVLQKIKEFLEFKELLASSKTYKTEIIMKKNHVSVSGSQNFNINISEREIEQEFSQSYNTTSELNDKFSDLIKKLEKEISKIKLKISAASYSEIVNNIDNLKMDIQNKTDIKKNTKSLSSIVKTIGDIGAPLLKIIGEMLN